MTTPAVESAKEFLISRILDEAKREGITLSDVEVQMLSFAETSANPMQMRAARAFETDYDGDQYEERIANLIQHVYESDVLSGRKLDWDRALDEVADEDLYLAVMLERAGLLKTTNQLALPDGRLLLGLLPALIAIALAGIVGFTRVAARLIPNDTVRLVICIVFLLSPWLINTLRPRKKAKARRNET